MTAVSLLADVRELLAATRALDARLDRLSATPTPSATPALTIPATRHN